MVDEFMMWLQQQKKATIKNLFCRWKCCLHKRNETFSSMTAIIIRMKIFRTQNGNLHLIIIIIRRTVWYTSSIIDKLRGGRRESLNDAAAFVTCCSGLSSGNAVYVFRYCAHVSFASLIISRYLLFH